MAESHLVQLMTERFRTSPDPLWVRIRHLLIEGDLDPTSMVLAYFAEEDFKFRFGIFVSGDGRIFQFGFDFAGKKSCDGRFSEWHEITGTWRTTPFRRAVRQGLDVLEGEKKDLRS